MGIEDLFGDALWRDVARDLRWGAARWWKRHRDTLSGLTKGEMEDIALSLRARNTTQAKVALARLMTREEFTAYQRGTTAQLQGIAARRAAALKALEELGRFAIKAVGTAILAVL